MGTEVRVWAFSDVTFAGTGEKVEADVLAVILTFGKDTVKLDLTKAEYDRLHSQLSPFLLAGHKRKDAAKRGRKPKAYYDALRRFAESEGVFVPKNEQGKYDYPLDIRRKFDEKMAGK